MKRRGISLIVLIVTIIVIIILAAVVILTLSKNNPIESAREATFKEDIRTFQDELAMYIAKEYTSKGGARDNKITETDSSKIKDYIPSFNKKYEGKFVIQDDELVYVTGLNDIEKEWCDSLNIKCKLYTELMYIESNGNQWIDTNVVPTENLVLKIDFTPLELTAGYLLGCLEKDQIITFRLFNPGSGTIYYDFNGRISGNSLPKDERVNIELHNNYVVKNGEMVLSGNVKSNLNISKTIYLFGGNTPAGPSPTKSRLYSCKIYDNNVLVRDYIPVLDQNNKPAIYDRVEKKYYYNLGKKEEFDYKLK